MKRISLIITVLLGILMMASCGRNGKVQIDKDLIIGKWKSTSANYYEVYNSDGTGKMWNEDDDVTEAEADIFTWKFETGDNTKFTQVIEFHSGAASIPQMCNVVVLNESSFTYNNDGWRRTENLMRVK